jgi:hypothetical protein
LFGVYFLFIKKWDIEMKKLLCTVAVIAVCFNTIAMNKGQLESSFSGTTSTATTETPQIPIVNWERYSPLSSEEELAVYKGTWNSDQTLEQNILALNQRFCDTCCLFFGGSGDFIIRTPDSKEIRYKKLSQDKIDQIIVTIQQMSLNPVGCKLIRLLLTKYLTGDTASKFSKIYIVEGNENGLFKFGHARCADKTICTLPVSHFSSNEVSLFAGNVSLAQKIMTSGKSCHAVNGFLNLFFFGDNIDSYADASLFGAMLRWLHLVSGIDIVGLRQSTDAIFKRYIRASSESGPFEALFYPIKPDLVGRFSNDSFFRCMFGIMYNKEPNKMMMDPLNESAYMLTGYNAIRLFCSQEKSHDIDFLESFGDKELLEFYFNGYAKLPKFGVGQYLCSDIDPVTDKGKI